MLLGDLGVGRIRLVSFHHELFHAIDLLDDRTLVDEHWERLNPDSFEYGKGGDEFNARNEFAEMYAEIPGFLSEYSTSAVEEDKAEVFASMIVDCDYVEERARDDLVVLSKMQAMKQLTLRFSASMGTQFWQDACTR